MCTIVRNENNRLPSLLISCRCFSPVMFQCLLDASSLNSVWTLGLGWDNLVSFVLLRWSNELYYPRSNYFWRLVLFLFSFALLKLDRTSEKPPNGIMPFLIRKLDVSIVRCYPLVASAGGGDDCSGEIPIIWKTIDFSLESALYRRPIFLTGVQFPA